MTPLNNAKHRSHTFNVAVDVDLTLLDTLTPWLDLYGMKLEDVQNDEPTIWADLSNYLEEHGTPTPDNKYKTPYEYWLDPLTYVDAKLTENFMEYLVDLKQFLIASGKTPVFFIISTCIASHVEAKKLRIKELTGDFFEGFIDTSDKYLVDFDLLIDDSPHQCLQAAATGKNSLLVPAPMNNKKVLLDEWDNILYPKGDITMLGGTYGAYWTKFKHLDKDLKISTFLSLIGDLRDELTYHL